METKDSIFLVLAHPKKTRESDRKKYFGARISYSKRIRAYWIGL
jgi:hypothetical protein